MASQGNPQEIYPFFERNINQFNESFIQTINDWANIFLSQLSEEFAQRGAGLIGELGNLINQFPLGDKGINLEIGITCYQAALRVFQRDQFPQEWATIQNNLANASYSRIKGDKADNIEKAITAYEKALQIYTKEALPVEWASTQNNLAAAYSDRIKGDKADNLEKAIAASEKALQIFTKEALPVEWASTQNNLGGAYSNRIKGDKADNPEKAIAAYENALQTYTKEAFPIEWAITKNNLAAAYRERIKGDKADNIEKAIASSKNALQIRTKEAFPVKWAMTQNNLAVAYCSRIQGDKADNLEEGIITYEKALQIYTKEAFPVEWATTKNNLAGAYYSRIKGDKADNIEKAIQFYRNSLQVQTAEYFPFECLQNSRNLGDLGFKEGNWKLAIEGYSIAIEAVENLRTEAISEIRRQEIMAEAIEVYQNIVQSYINLEQIDKAIEYVERSKTRDLVELLANRDLYPKGDIPQTVITELDRLRREIINEGKQLANQESSLNNNLRLENSPDTPQQTIPNRSKLNQLKQELDNFIKDKITPEDPTFSLTQKVETISFDEIKNLTDNNTAIIQWYITEEKILTFIISSDSQQPIIQQFPAENKHALIDEINKYLNLYLSDKKQWQNQLESILKKFAQYLHLDEIISNVPKECNSLILIPHRFIHLLPIHALPSGSQKSKVKRQKSKVYF